MSRWRIAILILLTAAPFVALACYGAYALWERDRLFLAWWPLAGSLALAYLLGWYWQRKKRLLHPPDFSPGMHWTDRDREAWKLVQARAQQAPSLDPDRLADVPFYLATGQEMAHELVR